ncbi:MAG: hypothetical protein ACOH5I_25085 [Oligoflexus sp.]
MEREFNQNTLINSPTSRISWGAIFAGVFVAFFTTLILNSLGIAIGLTGDGSLGTGSIIWAVIVSLIALFSGGWVMSYLLNNETKFDAAIQATVLWGVLFFGILLLTVFGIQTGLSVLTGSLTAFAQQFSISELLNLGQQLGFDVEQMSQLQQRIDNLNVQSASGAWWSLLGMLVSWIAVVAGSLVGKNQAHMQKKERAYVEHRDHHSVA